MIIADSIAALRSGVGALRARRGRRIAFVPTLGNLHAGHARLMDHARSFTDAVVASIYVNPLQFGPNEDFAAYPRTLREDQKLLQAHGVALLFMPDDAVIYPRGREAHTRVAVPGVSDILCGAARPGHFVGVTTVVSRLFNLVAPDMAIFGKKDYQQLLLINLMSADLGLGIRIIGVDTVRAEDGLALSSRNRYLTADERPRAALLYATLGEVKAQLLTGGTIAAAEQDALTRLNAAGFRTDYVSVRRRSDLAVPTRRDRELVVLAAAHLGQARLIDNLEIDLNVAG